MKNLYLFGLLFLTSFFGYNQNTISLNECYEGLQSNYPLAKQHLILEQQKEQELSVLKTKNLPQLNLNAQATYQSEVTEMLLPNINVDPLNNDQYRVTLTANQLIFDGGKIKANQNLQDIITERKKQEVDVSMYQLKNLVNQLYFSILLIDEQTTLLKIREQHLKSKLNEVKSGIKNGLLLPSSDKVIEAELLKIFQQKKEATNNKSKYIASLSSLVELPITIETEFQKPFISLNDNSELNRPEIDLYNIQKEEIEQQQNLLSKSLAPELNGFATGGYGNPGLNMLKNNFTSYYIVGLKLNWKLFDWNGNKKQRQALDYTKDLIKNKEEVFVLNTNTAINEQLKEIETLENNIEIDEQLITLQQEVVSTFEAQLKNGVITTSEYMSELTKLYELENFFNQHKTKLKLAKATFNTLKGDTK